MEIALGFSDNIIRILDLRNLTIKKEIPGHTLSIFGLKYLTNGQKLMSVSRDARIKLWDAENNYELLDEIVAHMYAINDLELSPNGNYFATCSMDKSIKIWDAESMKLLKVIDKGRHAGHGTSVNKLWWSSYNGWLTSCSDDRTISVWQLDL